LSEPAGLALITIGSAFRGDQGIGPALCDVLPESVLQGICRFDLGSHIGFMTDCFSNHKAAIVIDSTMNGTTPGTVSILDLRASLDRAIPINIASKNGLLIAEELRTTKKGGKIPNRIIFFGVEADDLGLGELRTVIRHKMPQLVDNLAVLVSKVLETLKRDA